MSRTEIIIHSDGACSGNPGPGGWSACVETRSRGEVRRELLRGGAPETTNNVMELSGAAAGLAHALTLPEAAGAVIRLRTDSEYVLKGLRDWADGWKRRDWRTSAGDPVKNRHLWERLVDLRDRVTGSGTLELLHVRGHSGDPGNEAADAAAVAARDLSRNRSAPWAAPVETVGDPLGPGPDPGPAEAAAAFETEAGARGYRRYRDASLQKSPGYLLSMQRRVRDGDDTLYFLNVDVWDMGRLSRGAEDRISLEAHVQFNTRDGHDGDFVNVKTPWRGFEETEALFGRLWGAMGFGRYERAEPTPGGPG